MKIFVLDNYDSFTYNLVHYLEKYVKKVDVFRNDEVNTDIVRDYDKIVLSPGPGLPDEAGCLKEIIREYSGKIPILGVCLGLQAIAEVYGARLLQMDQVIHGESNELIIVKKSPLFEGLSEKIEVGHYHSWVVDEPSIPAELELIAKDEEGHIMALKHKKHPTWGLQFHPESILTPQGEQIIENWINN